MNGRATLLLALTTLAAAPVNADMPVYPVYPPVMMVPAQGYFNPYLVPYGTPMLPMPQAPVMPPMSYGVTLPPPAPAAAPAAATANPEGTTAVVAPVAPAVNPYLQFSQPNPFTMMMSMQSVPGKVYRPYEMRRVIDQAEKIQMMQMGLSMMTGFMKMGMPDAMNYFARKYKAKPGLSFDDVRDSLFLRANQLNMKKVGENLMWKDFQAVLNDQDAPRIEVYSFCDIAVGRDLLKLSPEFIVFLPCRVAIMEDADKAIWVLMLDWNLDWVAGYEQKLGLTGELIKGASDINKRLDEMMRAAANGDL